jgi:toxin CcdB
MRFDVYPMPPGDPPGYLLDVQSELLSALPSRMVVPLLPNTELDIVIRDVNPEFEIRGQMHMLRTQELASVRVRLLGRPIDNLSEFQDEINRALDILLTGF